MAGDIETDKHHISQFPNLVDAGHAPGPGGAREGQGGTPEVNVG